MIYWTLSLLLGLFVLPANTIFPPGSCDDYTNISEPWRNLGFTVGIVPGQLTPNDDEGLLNSWWRFTGIGGNKVSKSCGTSDLGGTSITILIGDTEHPSTESLTPRLARGLGLQNRVCDRVKLEVDIVLCPGGFYIYRPLSHPQNMMGYLTMHNECEADSCGPRTDCLSSNGKCVCKEGYLMNVSVAPTQESFPCYDIDECAEGDPCGLNTICTNNQGSFSCPCKDGYSGTDPESSPEISNQCTDIDECLTDPCGDSGTCMNNDGSFTCDCNMGYQNEPEAIPICQDIDECLDSTICGPDSICTNIPGTHSCSCEVGYRPTQTDQEPSNTNICIDIDECDEDVTICGPDSDCKNTIGSYICTCSPGYRLNQPDIIASFANPCTDVDECSETPDICGKEPECSNAPGTYHCSCPDGFYPSTGILWFFSNSFCRRITDILDEITPPEGLTKGAVFLLNMHQQLQDNPGISMPRLRVANCFSAAMEVSGVGPHVDPVKVGSEGDGKTGSLILVIADLLIDAMVPPNETRSITILQTPTVDLTLLAIGASANGSESVSLSAKNITMEINLQALARANNGSAAVSFMILNGMETLLSKEYFKTENITEMYSDVFTAILPINNTDLAEPVNFTIQHRKKVPESGIVNCVYWEDKRQDSEENKIDEEEGEENLGWSEEGCWVSYSDENYTVCSCSHLSTFALIMQIGEPPPESAFLEWLNRVCVSVGLFFFALAVLTFLLCSWNPKINNTARLHLCLCLGLSHLLLLWNDRFLQHELTCTVMAGILHFLVVASFVWMLLEAVQLYLLVRRLSKVQVIQRDGLPRLLLYLIGYGVPLVVVGTSALVFSDGYGSTEAGACWLSRQRNFNWALTGPVISILGMNCILFLATLWGLRPTLANMKSDVSQSTDTRLIVFKIVAQFVILGLPWILGLYQTNIFFQILFIILNSQQGTCLYIVHCLLNKEVREEYIRWLNRTFEKNTSR